MQDMQDAVASGDLPPLDVDAANVLSWSVRSLQDHVRKNNVNLTMLKDLMHRVLDHPDFNAASDELDHDVHERLLKAVEDGDIEVIDMWEEGVGYQDNTVTFASARCRRC